MTSAPSILDHDGLFDLPTAVLLAEASREAYEPSWATWLSGVGFGDSGQSFDLGNIQGFWAAAGPVALLAFRGTDNLGQIIRDARLLPVTHAWGKVHVGFHTGLAAVDALLEDFDAVTQGRRVWITGHSLGGALAVLAGTRLRMKGIDCRVYTYGQPRVGFSSFAEKFDTEMPGRLIRLVNQRDIVSMLPPPLGYRHCGTVKRIVRPGVLQARGSDAAPAELKFDDRDLPPPSEAEAERLAAAFDADPAAALGYGMTPQGRLLGFEDHRITGYIKLLKELL